MRGLAARFGWALIRAGDRLDSAAITPLLYRLGSRLEVWGTDYRPRPRGPMDPDAAFDDVQRRYPNIMKRLAE